MKFFYPQEGNRLYFLLIPQLLCCFGSLFSRSKAGWLGLFVLFVAMTGAAQTTYTTKAAGNWSNASIWEGGVVPGRTVSQTMTVNIQHEVVWDGSSDLVVSGRLNILGDTLLFPSTFSGTVKVSNAGQLLVKNGGFVQSLASSSNTMITGARMVLENARAVIARQFTAQNGGGRSIRNSVVQVGATYTNMGNTTQKCIDTIEYSSIETGLSTNGDLSNYNGTIKLVGSSLQITNGSFNNQSTGVIATEGGSVNSYAINRLKVGQDLINDGAWNARIYSHCVGGLIKGSLAADIDLTKAQDCLLPVPPSSPAPQLVLNELYPDPDAGNNEFFELYNMSSTPEPVDNYAMVMYFEAVEGKGFYVLDFPAYTIPAQDFFVGTSAFPFSFQGLSPSMQAVMNWNKLSTAQGGRLQKWVQSTDNNKTDGNQYYNLGTLPGDGLNDLFNRFATDNAFVILLYKNGVLINQVIAGTGGRKTMFDVVVNMPRLQVDMLGSAPDFSIDFSKFAGLPVENIVPDVGTDNGYTRNIDGGCGTWRKASTASKYTPMQSNGGTIQVNAGGDLSIAASINSGTPTAGSTVVYSATGSNSLFPAELRVYVDNGTLPGQFDVNDSLVAINTANFSGQNLSTKFKPFDANIFIVAKQATGCIDQMQMLLSNIKFATLPVRFSSFTAKREENGVGLSWKTEDEAGLRHFVVQKSVDGKRFSDLAIVLPELKTATGYQYKDGEAQNQAILYYRIKAVDASGGVLYSVVCIVRPDGGEMQPESLSLYPNPASSTLHVSLPANWQSKTLNYQLFNANGSLLQSGVSTNSGQAMSLGLSNIPPGLYLLKITSGHEEAQQRFIKH